jgi:hypothetical protein
LKRPLRLEWSFFVSCFFIEKEVRKKVKKKSTKRLVDFCFCKKMIEQGARERKALHAEHPVFGPAGH